MLGEEVERIVFNVREFLHLPCYSADLPVISLEGHSGFTLLRSLVDPLWLYTVMMF